MAQCGILWQGGTLWHSVVFYGTEWHSMAKSGGTLPGERRRAGREEQVAVAGRPTGQPHCKANFPQASQLGWSPFEAFSNNLILRSPKTTLAKGEGRGLHVILRPDTQLFVKGLESLSQGAQLARHVLPSPKMTP